MSRASDLRARFRDLHSNPPAAPTPGILVMPNPWDVGSAKILETLGAAALATTSAGMAAAMGRDDQRVGRDGLVAHAAQLAAATELPLNVDAENCFADDVDGVVETVRRLAGTDAAGFSIEDYDPTADAIVPIDEAAARVTAAKEAGDDLVVTARAEQLLHGSDDLDETIDRLVAYRAAGADVVYAPGLVQLEHIERVVRSVDAPVNVLALPSAPSIPELAAAGVARVSLGSLLAWAAYGALVDAVGELFGAGTSQYADRLIPGRVRRDAFG